MITHRGPYDSCQGVQLLITALLGQIYGALSKVRVTSRRTYFIEANINVLESGRPHHKSGIPSAGLLLGKALRNVRQSTVFHDESAVPEFIQCRERAPVAGMGRTRDSAARITRISYFGWSRCTDVRGWSLGPSRSQPTESPKQRSCIRCQHGRGMACTHAVPEDRAAFISTGLPLALSSCGQFPST